MCVIRFVEKILKTCFPVASYCIYSNYCGLFNHSVDIVCKQILAIRTRTRSLPDVPNGISSDKMEGVAISDKHYWSVNGSKSCCDFHDNVRSFKYARLFDVYGSWVIYFLNLLIIKFILKLEYIFSPKVPNTH